MIIQACIVGLRQGRRAAPVLGGGPVLLLVTPRPCGPISGSSPPMNPPGEGGPPMGFRETSVIIFINLITQLHFTSIYCQRSCQGIPAVSPAAVSPAAVSPAAVSPESGTHSQDPCIMVSS